MSEKRSFPPADIPKKPGRASRAIPLGSALALGQAACNDKASSQTEPAATKPKNSDQPVQPWSFSNPDFFKTFPNGAFSEEEKQRRTERLPHGETVFHDIGLTFYRVERGDTRAKITQKLAQYPDYQYLLGQTEKLKSFNIPDASLREGMNIPIPIPNHDRELPDSLFATFADAAIEDLLGHPDYGPFVRAIIQKCGKKELVAAMVAIAKQESGGQPLGQFELHRWEPRYKVFSFSLFHILMTDHGLLARKKLNLTEGQLYHPKNAAKLFLGFLIEKTRSHAAWLQSQHAHNRHINETAAEPKDFFPLVDHHLISFTRFYNGSAWHRINPRYPSNLERYHQQAWQMLNPGTPLPQIKSNEQPKVARAPSILHTPHVHPHIRYHQKGHRGGKRH
ncbi:MAG TPA: hypothetical protein VFQ60_01015 [Patescibacteria group bacterium]|nr:hypothetical protein [Patescibacteria group bacterium]